MKRDGNEGLQLASYEVRDVRFGKSTSYSAGVLTVDKDELRALILESPSIGDVAIDIVAPGDDVRVIHILDIAEPRVRTSNPGVDFPGVVGPLHPVGFGVTNRLSGMAVTQTLPALPTEPVYWREAILDMGGDGARYSEFAKLRHLVLSFTPASDLSFEGEGGHNVFEGSPEVVRFKNEVRAAALRAAVHLARTTIDLAPDHVETFDTPPVEGEGLPRFVYMDQVQGPRFYGQLIPRAGAMAAQQHPPFFVNPAEVLDGALVQTSSLGGTMRDFTYLLQNHPVIKEMYRRHGTEIDFRGMLLCSNGDNPTAKQTVATMSAGLARYLGADGVVLSHLGGGHPMVDVMRTCKELESYGIKTVLLLMETSSTPGESGFVDFVTEADAIVSTGNFEGIVHLEPVGRVIGGSHIMELGDDASGPLDLSLRHIAVATSAFGVGRLRGAEV